MGFLTLFILLLIRLSGDGLLAEQVFSSFIGMFLISLIPTPYPSVFVEWYQTTSVTRNLNFVSRISMSDLDATSGYLNRSRFCYSKKKGRCLCVC